MNANTSDTPIPFQLAEKLCGEIRTETEANWYTESARWCLNCQKSAVGNLEQRGFLRQPGNRGCALVNARFDVGLAPG
ncbi:MAG: hypothetical protein A2Z16_15195 [Chloroflexi bacterium RBG_16_54_18]|nr:MAG: hypothetical protein A2Z16_15195 [Chloroflexi bacterium RBG_16_54_18]